MVYNRKRREWIQFKPADWTLKNFSVLEFAAHIFMDKELIDEEYANMTSDSYIKFKELI